MVEYDPMRPRRSQTGALWALCALGVFSAACATRFQTTASQAPPPVVVVAPPPAAPAPEEPLPDPVADLIALSNKHFETGQRELQEGHLDTAKTEFNAALEVLLESPFGARTEPRIREHFDRLVERISAYEVTALAQGDGFTEKTADEPASIDDLLAISTFEQPEATPETTQTVTEDLRETVHDIEIPLNAKVLSYVQLFTGRLKGYLEEGMSRGTRYLPMIQDVFRAEGLPLDLAYVPLIESAFKPNALSRAKAKGIWQFMRGTGLENGLKHDWYIDERSDPEKATYAAAKYLKTLHKMFGGDWHLALASYNGGPGRVQRAMKRSGRKDFWALTATTRYLPRETRDYVPLILAAVIIARNPAQYGLNIQPLETPDYEVVTLPSAVDLRRVAEWAGAPVQDIQDLNPELRRWTTPVRATDYELKVPAGAADLVRTALVETAPEELAPLNRHTVKKGETLLTISRKLKVSRADLAEANYLSASAKLKTGQQLIIPRAPTLLLATRADNPAPLAESRSGDVVVASNAVTPEAKQPAEPAPTKVIHRVKRGETLFSIARLYRTTVESLKQWNRIRGSAIQVGQRLTIIRNQTVATN
jgi:membrane-bound lytic murein transglycosylase D